MWKLFERFFAWGKFRTNLGEGSPVKELPTKLLTADQIIELRQMFQPRAKPIQVWYDPRENALYTMVEGDALRTSTYADIGHHVDETGSKYYIGGLYGGVGGNPRTLGLYKIGEL